MALDSIESFTIGGADGVSGTAAARPNWMPAQ
jgi:hypothetical protein